MANAKIDPFFFAQLSICLVCIMHCMDYTKKELGLPGRKQIRLPHCLAIVQSSVISNDRMIENLLGATNVMQI